MHQNLPASNLPPVTAGSTHPKIDPSNPTGIIPSTGASVYEIDLNQFEGSGQPWRRPGSDLSDWFNFGFDEITYPKFLRFRSDMEAGRQALVSFDVPRLPRADC
jgi:pre-mRNA 3'-end-processing factor FIP1